MATVASSAAGLRRKVNTVVFCIALVLLLAVVSSSVSVLTHPEARSPPPLPQHDSGCTDGSCGTTTVHADETLEGHPAGGEHPPPRQTSRVDVRSTTARSSLLVSKPFKFHVYDVPAKYGEEAIELMTKNWARSFCNRHKVKTNYTMLDWRHAHSLFTADVFISRYLRLHPQHTSDPSKADAFIIPTMMHVYNCAGVNHYGAEVLSWVKEQRGEYYRAHDQHDHYFFWWRWGMPKGPTDAIWKRFKALFGNANIMSYDFLELQGRNYYQDFSLALKPRYKEYQHGIIVPYPDFSPHLREPVQNVYATRPTLFFFTGTSKIGGIRRFIKRTCDQVGNPSLCSYVEFGGGVTDTSRLAVPVYASKMKESVFCGHAAGDALSSRRPTQAVLAGCIPVMICDLCLYAWENFIDYTSFALFVSEEDVIEGRLLEILKNVPAAKIHELQTNLATVRQHFIYHEGKPEPDDALDMLVKQLELRGLIYRQHRRWMKSNEKLSSRGADYPVDPPDAMRYVRSWNKENFNGLPKELLVHFKDKEEKASRVNRA